MWETAAKSTLLCSHKCSMQLNLNSDILLYISPRFFILVCAAHARSWPLSQLNGGSVIAAYLLLCEGRTKKHTQPLAAGLRNITLR
jgi:hypothetical protein